MTVPTENVESEILAKWLKDNEYTFTHIANESWLPPKVAMLSALRKKRMWLSRWVPDFMIVLKRQALLFIELKRQIDYSKSKNWRKYSTVSLDQEKWQEELNMIAWVQCEISWGSEEAINLIKRIECLN